MMNGLGARANFVRLLLKKSYIYILKLLLTMGVHNVDIYQMFCTQHIMRPLRCKYMPKKLRKLYHNIHLKNDTFCQQSGPRI